MIPLTKRIMTYSTKEKQREYGKKYYQLNKEEIGEKRAEHYQLNKEKKAEYYRVNKEKSAEYSKKRYQLNKEKISEKKAEYYKLNKEKISEKKAEYYQLNNEKVREQKREYSKKRKELCLEYLGGKCVKCGTTHNLQFDHIKREGKKYEITRKLTYKFDTLKEELDKCQLLCAPCHLDKTAKEWTK